MGFEDAFHYADSAIQRVRPAGEGLRDIERTVLEGSWYKKTYGTIADEAGYSIGYLSRDVGPALWKDLSTALGTNVSKKNFRNAIERWVHQNAPASHPTPVAPSLSPAAMGLPADWGALRIDVSDFRGRTDDIEHLSRLIQHDRCSLVGLVGIPGVGKTWLAVKLAHHLKGEFQRVVYRPLSDRPDPMAFVTELLIGCGAPPPDPTSSLERLCGLLVQQLARVPQLLVLDDADHLYQAGTLSGIYDPALQGYGTLLQTLSTQAHGSCLLWVGRAWPRGLPAMGRSRCYDVRGLRNDDVAQLPCWPPTLQASVDQWQVLQQWLGGVPTLMPPVVDRLKFVAYDLGRCLGHGTAPGISQYLEDWLAVLSAPERSVLTELAMAHQPKYLKQLLTPLDQETRFAVVGSLCDRGFCRLRVDESEVHLTLPRLLGPYLCDRWIQAFPTGASQPASALHPYPLMQADAPEPIQRQQRQQLLVPLAERLAKALPNPQARLDWVQAQLAASRAWGQQQPGYSAGNLLNLAQHWQLPLVDLDCRNLVLWGTDLQSDRWQGVALSGSDLDQTHLAKPLGRQPVMAMDPHHRAVAVGDQSGQLLLWQPQDGRLQAGPTFEEASAVVAVAFCPQGQTLAVGRQDGFVQLWTVGSRYGPELLTPEPIAPLQSVTYSPDGHCLAGGTTTGQLYLWRLDSGDCLHHIPAHQGPIIAIAFSPCGQCLTTAGQDGNAGEWDLETGEARARFQGRVTAWLGTVGYRAGRQSADPSQAIAIGRDEGQILLWDLASSRPYRILVEDCDTVTAALSPDGQYLAVSDIRCMVRIWSVTTRQLCHCLPLFDTLVTVLDFSPDGTILMTGGDYTVQLWHVATGDCWRSWRSQRHLATDLILTADTQILSLHRDQTLRCWGQSVAGWRPQTRLCLAGTSPGSTIAVGDRGQVWAIGDESGGLRLWSPQDHQWLGEPLHLSAAITALAFDRQETWLAVGESSGAVSLWHLPTQTCQWQHQAHGDSPTVLTFTPEGDRVFSGSRDRTIQGWTRAGKSLGQLSHLRQVHCLRALAGDQLLSGSQDGTVCLWDVASQQLQQQWQPPQNQLIYGVTVDLQGNPLAVAGSAQTLEVWDIGQDRHRFTLTDGGDTLWHVSLSPDGQLLLSASQTGQIHLWRIATGEHCAALRVDRPYEAMEIEGCTGLNPLERSILQTLGAIG
jgi:WD40 repeat protein